MKNRYVLLADLPLIVVAAFGAFALRFDWMFLGYRPEFQSFAIAALLIKPVILYAFGMYSRFWRYATADDLIAVTLAVSGCSVCMALYVGFGRALDLVGSFSRSVLLIDWLLSLALIGGLRMSIRVLGEAHQKAQRISPPDRAKRVIVVGAGEAGAMVVRELQRNPQLGIVPVGFLDDAPSKQGKWISNVQVLGRMEDLIHRVAAHQIDQVIIAMPAAGGAIVRTVADMCRQAGIESRIVPGVFELLDGQVSVSRVRTVQITDLLRREHLVAANPDEAERYLQDATVLVTGAGGSIGQELCRQVAHVRPRRLLLLGHGENSIFDVENLLRAQYPAGRLTSIIADIRDERRIEAVFSQYRPQVVLHAAAHKHVPLMEENPVEAISNNVLGTYTVASAALRHGTRRFVLISTDKAVAPTSIMGASKRIAEIVVRELAGRGGTAFVVVRFGNVLGSRGSVVPLFRAQIERGGPVTVTDPEMKRFFMTIPEAVNLVLRAGGLGGGGELFVLNMGSPVRIRDLAEDLIKLSGFSLTEIPIVFTQLRPGEKLEEALWEQEAVVQPTTERDILRVTEPTDALPVPLDLLLQEFQRAVWAGDRLAIEAALAQSIPTFVPSLPVAALFPDRAAERAE
jgi:FlaA1/EpsC-like NDP-sugar epimerase